MSKYIVRITLIILLIGCLLDMPYGYYTLVRLCGFVGFIYLLYQDYIEKRFPLVIFETICAITFNPIIKVVLKRDEWVYVDVIIASILMLTLVYTFISDKVLLKKKMKNTAEIENPLNNPYHKEQSEKVKKAILNRQHMSPEDFIKQSQMLKMSHEEQAKIQALKKIKELIATARAFNSINKK